MLSHKIIHHGSSIGRSYLQGHAMINDVEPPNEDRQNLFLSSPQRIKISEVQVKRLVLTPML